LPYSRDCLRVVVNSIQSVANLGDVIIHPSKDLRLHGGVFHQNLHRLVDVVEDPSQCAEAHHSETAKTFLYPCEVGFEPRHGHSCISA